MVSAVEKYALRWFTESTGVSNAVKLDGPSVPDGLTAVEETARSPNFDLVEFGDPLVVLRFLRRSQGAAERKIGGVKRSGGETHIGVEGGVLLD